MAQYSNITTATTTTVDTGKGVLRRIIVNTGATGTATIYDNTAGSGTKIGTITSAASTAPVSVEYEATYQVGLTVVTSAVMDVTVIYDHLH